MQLTIKVKLTILIIITCLAMSFNCESKAKTVKYSYKLQIIDSTKKAPAVSFKPKGPAPAWAPDIKPEMLAVIEKLASYHDKPLITLTPVEARKNHTMADAVKDLLKDHHISLPVYQIDTIGEDIGVTGGTIHLRIYTPKAGKGPFPIMLYFHAGGFVVSGIDAYDATPNILAEQTHAIAISVGFRLAPEYKFPTALMDGFAAYKWALANASSINGDPQNIALTGESAGGNICVNLAIMARDKNIQMPKHILAIYPVAGTDTATDSYVKQANAKPLSKAAMIWFLKYYINSKSDLNDPRLNLLIANFNGLPPTTIITDELDPVQSEDIALANKMKAAGVTVDAENYDGVSHQFFGMGAVIPQAREAEAYAAKQLIKAFKEK
ncbi:alpha/beta hydrolase [Mucilaginibacter sp. E4BP6]|uniref:alpha/beta hydrolase n=1 Tax=Mucilaginibacter sp. E4BP6 TaxID=2723089 RepID=UPI0015C84B49|nr:alpha/beta hydrolase [Mucilaginibacter sp. E4BP6]NYE66996.1 acetyl esterase/lipase [Mucilaginibacter sp. E4BP6]